MPHVTGWVAGGGSGSWCQSAKLRSGDPRGPWAWVRSAVCVLAGVCISLQAPLSQEAWPGLCPKSSLSSSPSNTVATAQPGLGEPEELVLPNTWAGGRALGRPLDSQHSPMPLLAPGAAHPPDRRPKPWPPCPTEPRPSLLSGSAGAEAGRDLTGLQHRGRAARAWPGAQGGPLLPNFFPGSGRQAPPLHAFPGILRAAAGSPRPRPGPHCDTLEPDGRSPGHRDPQACQQQRQGTPRPPLGEVEVSQRAFLGGIPEPLQLVLQPTPWLPPPTSWRGLPATPPALSWAQRWPPFPYSPALSPICP